MKKSFFRILFLVLLCNSAILLAQNEPESIVPETDKFQDYFYESLKQKGIENYDKAITALEVCLQLKPNEAVVYSEMGKNYLGLKNYEQSYVSYQKAAQIDPKNKWFWAGMYEVNYQTKNYNQAIANVLKLTELDAAYKEDLVSLYMYTQQLDKALALIDELNQKVGKSEMREKYKAQILSQGKSQNTERNNLVDAIQSNPKSESNYIALFKMYLEKENISKANEVLQKLQTEFPNSVWAELGRYKKYLEKNDISNAYKAIQLVLENNQIDANIKQRVGKDFLNYLDKNPKNTPVLDSLILPLEKYSEDSLSKDIGNYFYSKKVWDKAILFYEKALKNNSTDALETYRLLFQSYVQTKQFEILAQKAANLMETYPSQPEFYYFSGLANNQLKRFKNAINWLELGLDFVVNNSDLEANFNLQLAEAYNGLSDFKKKEYYFTKANTLVKEKNKK